MNLDALKALLRSATPGPWRKKEPQRIVFRGQEGPLMSYLAGSRATSEGMTVSLGSERIADHELIPALYNAAPALIACAEALREYLEWGAMTRSDRELFRAKFENRLKALEDA